MGDGVRPDVAHVPGHHVVPAPEVGHPPAQGAQGDGGPGAGSLGQSRMAPGGPDELEDVLQDLVVHKHPVHLGAQAGELGAVGGLGPLPHGVPPELALEQLQLVRRGGVAHAQAQGEAVQLGVGQQLGAGGPGGVLGGDDQEGVGHRAGHPVHRHPALLHGLQQGGLGTAGGPVQLVRQEQVAEQGPGLVLHLARGLVVEGEPGEVRGHHIGGELHPVILQAQGLGEGDGQGGFAHAGDILQEQMAPGQNGQQGLHHDVVLAHHGLLYLGHHLGGKLFFQHHCHFLGNRDGGIISKKGGLEQPPLAV